MLVILHNRVNPEFLELLKPYCKIKYIWEAFPFRKKNIIDFLEGDFDLAFYTISQAIVIGSWLLSRAGYRDTRVVLGAFQTEIFCAPHQGFRIHRRYIHWIIKSKISPESIIFGNTATKNHHSKKLNFNFDASPVIRLFIDLDKYKFKDRVNLPRTKIVSIGRLVSYKTYNFSMLTVIKNLKSAFFPLQWHIYGDGDLTERLNREIMHLNLENSVFLHGPINYSKFEDVLEDAFLFVGTGTSLLEAAACGVPALTAIEYCSDPLTYGNISNIKGIDMFEKNLNIPIYKLEECIKKILTLPSAEYATLQRCDFNKSTEYSGGAIISKYIKVFEHTKNFGKSINLSSYHLFIYFSSALIGEFINTLNLLYQNRFRKL